MKRFLVFALAICSVAVAADRPIILVTPQGVWQSTTVNGQPGPWEPLAADVIVQGFSTGTPVPPTPGDGGGDVPDPVVAQITAFTKATLQTKDEAVAIAALIDSLVKNGMSGTDLVESMQMGAKILDASIGSQGRLIKWADGATKITSDPEKLKAGVTAAFGVSNSSVRAVSAAVDGHQTEEAADFLAIIEIIKMVIEILRNLGVI